MTYLDIVFVKGLIRSGREVSDLDLHILLYLNVVVFQSLLQSQEREEREREARTFSIILTFNQYLNADFAPH